MWYLKAKLCNDPNGSILKQGQKIWGQVFLPRELLNKSLAANRSTH